jgi:hypothetical protein
VASLLNAIDADIKNTHRKTVRHLEFMTLKINNGVVSEKLIPPILIKRLHFDIYYYSKDVAIGISE